MSLQPQAQAFLASNIEFIGLCSWVVNIIGFYNVYCDVEPKRRALEAANADLAAAEDKVAKIKAKIKVHT